MGERRDGLRPGRDAAALVGDAILSSLEHLVARLHQDGPAEGAPRDATTAAAPPPATRSPPAPPAAVAAFAGALVAAMVPAILRRLDPDQLVDWVGVQRVVDRVDVQGIVDRVDLDALVARVDVDALVERLDVDAIVRRIDLEAVTREALEAVDIGDVVRESTATIGSDIVEDARAQSMRADALLARGIDRVLRRRGPRRTSLPTDRGAS